MVLKNNDTEAERLSCACHFNITLDFCDLGELTYWTCLVYCVLVLSYEGDGMFIFQQT